MAMSRDYEAVCVMIIAILSSAIASEVQASNGSGGSADTDIKNFDVIARSADAFNASGTISSLNNGKILAGHWTLRVIDGNISRFQVDFDAVSIDGMSRDGYSIGNSHVPAVVPILIDDDGATFPVMADIKTSNGTLHSVEPYVSIVKLQVLKIVIDDERVDKNLGSRPIYGVVDSIQIKPPGPP